MRLRRRGVFEVQMYPILRLAIDAVGRSRIRVFYHSPGKETLCLVQEAGWAHGCTIQLRRRGIFFPL